MGQISKALRGRVVTATVIEAVAVIYYMGLIAEEIVVEDDDRCAIMSIVAEKGSINICAAS